MKIITLNVLHSSRNNSYPIMLLYKDNKFDIPIFLTVEQAKRLHFDLEEAIKLLEVKGCDSP